MAATNDILAEASIVGSRKSKINGGRYGFDDYEQARVEHIEIKGKVVGDVCSCCKLGRLYDSAPRKILQFVGNAPVEAKRYLKEVLRCNGCGIEFASSEAINKWQASARTSIILQKVNGMPFNRLAKLQRQFDIPVARSSLWQQCLDMWNDCGQQIYERLLEVAAQGQNFYVDDTRAQILEVTKSNKQLPVKQRRACNTTVVCTEVSPENNKSSKISSLANDNDGGDSKERHKIVLYITSNKYCSENISPLIARRDNANHRLRIMADASGRNIPLVNGVLAGNIIMANCLAHARRKFHELLEYYPEQCSYFLGEIAAIYRIDAEARHYSDRKRLKYHKQHSAQHIRNIYNNIRQLFASKQVEPNSSLGGAMRYWLKHKVNLTRFMRVKGIGLDNNLAERSLRSIILQRKNSLFFGTKDSAVVLSGLSSIVKTCEMNDISAYGYLNWLQDNWRSSQEKPSEFLPWHYREHMKDQSKRLASIAGPETLAA